MALGGSPALQRSRLPEYKDARKNRGWSQFNFPQSFENQGQCIQYVNTGK